MSAEETTVTNKSPDPKSPEMEASTSHGAQSTNPLEPDALVIHPTRVWPWFGIVSQRPCWQQPSRLCEKCLKEWIKKHSTNYEDETAFVDAAEEQMAQEAQKDGEGIGMEIMCSDLNDMLDEYDYGTDNTVSIEEVCHCGRQHAHHFDHDDYEHYEPVEESSCEMCLAAAESQTEMQKGLEVVWLPDQLKTQLDGTEVVVGCSRNMYPQEGQSTCRAAEPHRRGIIKQLRHKDCDALILPECTHVVVGLKPENRIDIFGAEANDGLYVLYEGWLGNVNQMWHRVTFETSDGRRFTKTEVDGVVEMNMNEYLAGKTVSLDMHTVFEGQTLAAPNAIMSQVEWIYPENYEPDEVLAAKIAASEQFWGGTQSDSHWPSSGGGCEIPPRRKSALHACTDPDTELALLKEALSSASAYKSEPGAKSAAIKKKKYEETKAKLVISDRVELTIVKVELMKMSVEWRCPVSKDAEEHMVTTFQALTKEETDKAEMFKVPNTGIPTGFRLVGSSKFGYRISPDDLVITVEEWRRKMLVEKGKVCAEPTQPCTSGVQPTVRSVYQLTGRIEASVLWQDGQLEHGVSCDTLMHPVAMCDIGGKDYFPAMYVQLDPKGAEHEEYDAKRNRFGLVLIANNEQKFAKVRWFEPDQVSPRPLEEEEVSFYDIRSHSEYNYVSGSVVSRLTPLENDHRPNVGYVIQKLPDGMVEVRWYGDTENKSMCPWQICKLRAETYAVYSDDGSVGPTGQDGMYSPSEHELEYLEELRYFDYSTLEETERFKRIALISELLAAVLNVVQRVVSIIHSRLPTLDRRQMLKLCLYCDDIANGYCRLERFQTHRRRLFDEIRSRMSDDSKKENNSYKSKRKMGWNDEEAVWHMSTWMYDWLEVTRELQYSLQKLSTNSKATTEKFVSASTTDVEGYCNSSGKDTMSEMGSPNDEEQQQHNASCSSAVSSTSSNCSSANKHNSNCCPTALGEAQNEKDCKTCESTCSCSEVEKVLAEISESVQLIQSAFTVITQIVGRGQTVEACAPITGDCLLKLNTHLNNVSAAEKPSKNDGDQAFPVDVEDLKPALQFSVEFDRHGKKFGRLPCFDYSMPLTSDMKQALETIGGAWKMSSLTDTNQTYLPNAPLVSCSGIIRSALEFIKKQLLPINSSASLPLSEMLQTNSNLLADAMSASVVLLLPAINNQIREELADYRKQLQPLIFNKTVEVQPPVEGGVEDSAMGKKPRVTSTCSDDHDVEDLGSVLSPTSFEVLDKAPLSHRFVGKMFAPETMPKRFMAAARKELKTLQTSLPAGISVKAFENRLDLFSCMIQGPEGTPYAYGAFFFDIRLKDDYPVKPPHVFYHSMSKKLNPNLYEDGLVCLSLLGTWEGRETELWTFNSTLLQVFVSIQSLVLVSEPYFNEPGYESERGTPEGSRKARDFNEIAILRTLDSLQKWLTHPPAPFQHDFIRGFLDNGPKLLRTLERYQNAPESLPFPLAPITQGFRLCVKRHATDIQRLLDRYRNPKTSTATTQDTSLSTFDRGPKVV